MLMDCRGSRDHEEKRWQKKKGRQEGRDRRTDSHESHPFNVLAIVKESDLRCYASATRRLSSRNRPLDCTQGIHRAFGSQPLYLVYRFIDGRGIPGAAVAMSDTSG